MMIVNQELFSEQFRIELIKRGLNPKAGFYTDYVRGLSIEQEKQLMEARNAAMKRTRELQNLFPATLGVSHGKLAEEWIARAEKRENGIRVPV